MSIKKLPVTSERLKEIAKEYGTPFHLYDEAAMRENARRLHKAFSWAPKFKEHFAVKAQPNPYILEMFKEEGCGADCSSMAELKLSEAVGIKGEDICFTSNDTPIREYEEALRLGAIINLDDYSHIEFLEKNAHMPELISFRYNPGPLRQGGNEIIGYPEEAKYGFTKQQVLDGFALCRDKGAKRFGLHTMIVSNELKVEYLEETAHMMFDLAVEIKDKLGISVEFINLGGGIGIPYHPDDEPVDLELFGAKVKKAFEDILVPAGLGNTGISLESGRMMAGPYGYLVSEAIHYKDTYKNYIGLDSCMADLMRPALYGAYHHVTVVGKEEAPCDMTYDITGSLCENNDKFAVDRQCPKIDIGDLIVLHDSGAHGYAMGFNYNGKLRSKELLLQSDGSIKQIRRAETLSDYFKTLDYPGLD